MRPTRYLAEFSIRVDMVVLASFVDKEVSHVKSQLNGITAVWVGLVSESQKKYETVCSNPSSLEISLSPLEHLT
jgi:hypothetical protein